MDKTLYGLFGKLYINLIAFCTAPLLIYTTPYLLVYKIPEIIFWLALEIIADLRSITIMRNGQVSRITMSLAIQFSAIMVLGLQEALWIVIIATIIVELVSGRSVQKAFFNAGQYGLSLLAGGIAFELLKLSPDTKLFTLADLPALAAGVCIFFFLNLFFVAAVITLTSENSFKDVFFSDIKIILTYLYTLAPISIAMTLLYDPDFPFVLLVMVPPVMMADLALNRYFNLQQETQVTLKLLADIVDERDKYTFLHSSRVSEYAAKIAEQLKLPEHAVEEVEAAGRVHDLGKISVRDSILLKESRLDNNEYTEIKKHPEVGHKLLKNLKPYKNGAEYVLYHHERHDGSGYPFGRKGDEIPLGARILSVADSYDAMTSDRPYRKAMPRQVAVNELRQYSGSQFDSEVVNAFINVLKNEYDFKEN